MKQFGSPIVLVIVLATCICAQRPALGDPVLAERITLPNEWKFRFDENVLMDSDKVLKSAGSKVAVRFCSTKPMLTLIGRYRVQLSVVENFLSQVYNYESKRLVMLRDNRCLDRDRHSKIEIWVIPEGARLPESIEMTDARVRQELSGGRGRAYSSKNNYTPIAR